MVNCSSFFHDSTRDLCLQTILQAGTLDEVEVLTAFHALLPYGVQKEHWKRLGPPSPMTRTNSEIFNRFHRHYIANAIFVVVP